MSLTGKTPYETKSAVLFVVFNRPETTAQVFEAIRIAKPKRLYITADGPRPNVSTDAERCQKAREIVNQVDWDCEVKTLFRNDNAGCKNGVSAALNWFFGQEEEGIILEDDCLPANSFFKFCDTLLEKYRYDTHIRHITGCNLQFGKKWGTASYYFSNRVHVWGWAGWKRAWNDYDITLEKYSHINVKEKFIEIYNDDLVAEAWANIFTDVKAGKVNSWAYPLDFATFFNDGLVIIPNQNLISNIGFRVNGTNTLDQGSIYANIPLVEMDEISHPDLMVLQKEADLSIIVRDFGIEALRRKRNSWGRRVWSWMKGK